MPDSFSAVGPVPLAPEPSPPVRAFSFTGFSTNNPTTPQPGDKLDAEFDRTNVALSQTLDWAATSLNTDGTLRYAIVGKNNLVDGLFDDVAQDIADDVQVLVDQAGNFAASAGGSASSANASAGTASAQAAAAAVSANTASVAAASANAAVAPAQAAAIAAANSATSAGNAADTATGGEAAANAYATLSMAWAEHMPDTIPPNILSIAGVTGDHWSSRWWANQASTGVSDGLGAINDAGEYWLGILQDQTEDAIQGIQSFYLGAFAKPPTTDSLGNPIVVGAMYFDLSLDAAYVWNGTSWRPLVTPGPQAITHYIYVATAGQTVFTGPDRSGNPLIYNQADLQTIDVFRKGILLTPADDYAPTVNHVTLVAPAAAGDIVQLLVSTVPVVPLEWNTVRLDTSTWAGTSGTLKDFQGALLAPGAVQDVMLSIDGVWQEPGVSYTLAGSTLTFNEPLGVGFKAFGHAIVPVQAVMPPVPGLIRINTTPWVFDGAAVTFPLADAGGTAVVPETSINLMISLNGVWQAAETDYTVAASQVTFAVAPEADALVFAVAGLPAFMIAG